MVFNICNVKIFLFLESKYVYVKKILVVDGIGNYIFINKYIGNINEVFFEIRY